MSGGATTLLAWMQSGTTSADTGDEQAIVQQLLDQAQAQPQATHEFYSVQIVPMPKPLRVGGLTILTEPPAEQGSSSSWDRVQKTELLTQFDMRRMAASSGRLLIAHVESGLMRPAQLAFAAELLGDLPSRAHAERSLLEVLRHESSLVRERAVYGLAKLNTSTARETLRRLSALDPSPGVREAATEALGG